MMSRWRVRIGWGALLLLLVGSLAVAAIQTARIQFQRLSVETPEGRPVVYHHVPSDSAVTAALAQTATGFIPAPLETMKLLPDTFTVVIAPSERAFVALTGGRTPDWGLAIAFPGVRQIVIRSPRITGRTKVDPAIVLRHEINHLYMGVAVGQDGSAVPRWFNEGFAALYANEWRWVGPFRIAWGRFSGQLIPLSELETTFPSQPAPTLSYMQSMAAVRSLQQRGGDEGIQLLLERVRDGASFDRAMRETYGLTLAQFYANWEVELSREYGPLVILGDQQSIWVLGALLVIFLYFLRRRQVSAKIRQAREREDIALGQPGDHSLGAEEWERYWEQDDDAWRGEDEQP